MSHALSGDFFCCHAFECQLTYFYPIDKHDKLFAVKSTMQLFIRTMALTWVMDDNHPFHVVIRLISLGWV